MEPPKARRTYSTTSEFDCPECGREKISKAGRVRGRQRYFCRDCVRYFVPGGNRSNKPKGRYDGATTRKQPIPRRSDLILHLQGIAQRLGKTPTTSDITQLSKEKKSYPLHVYYQVFGNFVDAVKAARLKANYRREPDRELLLAEVRMVRQKLGRALIYKDLIEAARRREISSTARFIKIFKTLPAAIFEAGAHRKAFSRTEIRDYLLKLHSELGRVPTNKDINARWIAGVTPSFKEVLRNFGSLEKARRAAGIRYRVGNGQATPYWRRYTPEELVEQMRRLKAELGRDPTDRDLNKASKEGKTASSTTFRSYFGSLASVRSKL